MTKELMIKDLVKIADNFDSVGLTKEADAIDNLIRQIASSNSDVEDSSLNKLAKATIKKPNKKLIKQLADETYETVLNNIEIAKSSENPNQSYKFWEGHIGLNIGWAKNRTAEAKKIIMKSKNEKLSASEKSELKKLIYEAMEAACYIFPIPITHHKEEDLKVFNEMNYAKACKCGEATDDDWYEKNCT